MVWKQSCAEFLGCGWSVFHIKDRNDHNVDVTPQRTLLSAALPKNYLNFLGGRCGSVKIGDQLCDGLCRLPPVTWRRGSTDLWTRLFPLCDERVWWLSKACIRSTRVISNSERHLASSMWTSVFGNSTFRLEDWKKRWNREFSQQASGAERQKLWFFFFSFRKIPWRMNSRVVEEKFLLNNLGSRTIFLLFCQF